MPELRRGPGGADPSIALAAPTGSPAERAARLLVTALGLPQVAVVAPDEIPESVHTVLTLAGAASTDARIWALVPGDVSLDSDVTLSWPGVTGEVRHEPFPEGEEIPIALPTVPGRTLEENVAGCTLFYARKRLAKRRGHALDSERMDAYVGACFLRERGGLAAEAADELVDVAFDDAAGPAEKAFARSFRAGTTVPWRDLAGAIVELTTASALIKETVRESPRKLSPATATQRPELLLAVLAGRKLPKRRARDLLDAAAPEIRGALSLSYLGLSAYLAGAGDPVEALANRLLSAELLDAAASCVRVSPDAKSYCYSPSLVALLLASGLVTELPPTRAVTPRRFEWRVFSGPSDWAVESSDGSGALLSASDRVVSASLMDNWLRLMSVPDLGEGQIDNDDLATRPSIHVLDSIWLAIFRKFQSDAGQPLVRVSPWPIGCTGAVSLRYDIDRPLTEHQVHRVLGIQERFHIEKSSWYEMPDEGPEGRPREMLAGQELAVHALDEDHVPAGSGVTFHSSPRSRYWRGRRSIEVLDAAGAPYAEMLATQFVIPRPGWLRDEDGGRPTSTWLLPAHFPLEGSTQDRSLRYFDRLDERWRELREIGGHLIVASHPDLNQSLLEQLLEREGLERLWSASIGDVVDRCRALLSYGSVRVNGPGTEVFLDRGAARVTRIRLLVHPPEGGAAVESRLDI